MVQISSDVIKNVVLVHGGFVDGSGWEDVYKILKRDGYNVSVVQNPTISLTGDVATTRAVLRKSFAFRSRRINSLHAWPKRRAVSSISRHSRLIRVSQ
jgi:hypothetical protein